MNIQAATILVVEHDKNSRESLVQSLSERGYEVIVAPDGHLALQILSGRSIDLVLLDTQMPVLSGLDILRALRNNAATETLPVIMLSTSLESEDTLRAFEYGANDVVTRPFAIQILLARVQAQLRAQKKPVRPVNKPQSSQSTTSNPGIIIAGQYRVEEGIGEGGFGAVFRAIRLSDNMLVAVKVLQTTLMPSQKALTRFQIEGITTRRVQHPNAVMVFDSGVTLDGLAFLVMELLSGMPLDKFIKLGPVSTKKAAEIMIPVCDAVNSAHQAKIIHRDIKPSNIFLHRENGREIPKVLDFGLAKIVDESFGENFTREGHVLGTVSYVAPERLRSQPYDGRSDIYSLGATFYELLVGTPPFTTLTPDLAAVAVQHLHDAPVSTRQRQPEISPELDALVLSMLEKDPKRRPSLPEIIQRLKPVAAGPNITPSARMTSGPVPTLGTMVLTEMVESETIPAKAAPVMKPQPSPTIKQVTPNLPLVNREERVLEIGESSILQSVEMLAKPVAVKPPAVQPPIAKPPVGPSITAKPPLPAPAAKPPIPITKAASPEEKVLEIGESSILQSVEMLAKPLTADPITQPPINPTSSPLTKPPAPLVAAKPPIAQAPIMKLTTPTPAPPVLAKPPNPMAPKPFLTSSKPTLPAVAKPLLAPQVPSKTLSESPVMIKAPILKPVGALPPPKPLAKPPPPLIAPPKPMLKTMIPPKPETKKEDF